MNLHYFNSTVAPRVGDYIATGKRGQSDILSITLDGELEVKNRLTGEVFHALADDCDLLEPAAPKPHPHVLHIASGAHHIDLRAADPHDPPDVTAARATEADILGRWLGVELN